MLTDRIGSYLSSAPRADDRLLDLARLRVLDILGCFIHARSLGLHDGLRRLLAPARGATGPLWDGSGQATPAESALYHGTVAHHLDMDDSRGSALVPTALALGCQLNATLGAVLDALVSGYEVVQLLEPLGVFLEEAGMHPPALSMTVGSAGIAARLRDLSAGQAASAVALAAHQAPLAPFESFTAGAPVKDLYAGWPAYIGVLSAEYAAAGLEGAPGVIDGVAGWQAAFAGRPLDWSGPVARLEAGGSIARVAFKDYSACRSVHPAMSALDRLTNAVRIVPSDILRVDVRTYSYAVELDEAANRQSVIGARASLKYAVAAFLSHGHLDPSCFTPEAVASDTTQALADRVYVAREPSYESPRVRGAYVRLTMKDGSRHEVEVRGSRWSPSPGFPAATAADIAAKFRRLADPVLGPGEARAIVDHVLLAPSDSPVRELAHLVAGAAQRTAAFGGAQPVSVERPARTSNGLAGPLTARTAAEHIAAVAVRLAEATAPAAQWVATRAHIVDRVAAAVAGSQVEGAQVFLDRAAEPDFGGATIWATGQRASALDAAIANAACAELTELATGPDVLAVIAALAEETGASAAVALRAFAVSSEIGVLVRGWLQQAIEDRKLHPPAITSTIAATVAACVMLNVPYDDWPSAVSAAAALTPLSPYASFVDGVTGKALYPAAAARTAIWAARLAHNGLGGAATVYEGQRGQLRLLRTTVSQLPRFGMELPAAGSGAPPPAASALARIGYKPYPANLSAQPMLTALEALRAEYAFAPDEVSGIEVETYPYAVELLQRAGGITVRSAALHLPTVAALFLLEGGLEPGSYARITPAVQALAGRVTVTTGRRFQSAESDGSRLRGADVRIRLHNGKTLARSVDSYRWSAEQPPAWAELAARAIRLMAPVVGLEAARAFTERVARFGEAGGPNVAGLFDTLG